MPRAAVKLSQSRESPPPWWPDEFHRRQRLLRPRILKSLRKADRAICTSDMYWKGTISGYSRAEADHAMSQLTKEGVVRRFDQKENYSQHIEKPVVRTYYELTDAEPRERKGDG